MREFSGHGSAQSKGRYSPKIMLFILTFISLLTSCSNHSVTCINERSFAEVSDVDLNNDGVADIHYEHTENGYYSFLDKNFDGKIDETNYYGNDDIIRFSTVDQDFDGIPETKISYTFGVTSAVIVDSNSDGFYDIDFHYIDGELSRSRRYLTSEDASTAYVEEIQYEFSYPKERRTKYEVHFSAKEFSESIDFDTARK